MKNVIKTTASTSSLSRKPLFRRVFRRSAAAILLSLPLSVLLLTGCVITYKAPVGTTKAGTTAVSGTQTTSGTKLPYGVTLQVDPSVLVACRFERVVDADTIIVKDPDGKRTRVRLTGINAPESVAEDESRNTEEGRIASKFMKELTKDLDTVYLEYDVGRKDQYDRTLAYVWIRYEDTYVMLNEIMLATGHAKPVYIKPNLRYADDFRKYEK